MSVKFVVPAAVLSKIFMPFCTVTLAAAARHSSWRRKALPSVDGVHVRATERTAGTALVSVTAAGISAMVSLSTVMLAMRQ